MLDLIQQGEWLMIYPTAMNIAQALLGGLVSNFGVVILALAALGYGGTRSLLSERYSHLALLGFLGNLVFWIIVNPPGAGRVHSSFFIIYPLAAVAVYWLVQQAAGTLQERNPAFNLRRLTTGAGLILVLNTALLWTYHSVSTSSFHWEPDPRQVLSLIPRLTHLLVQTGPGH
jgi:hypothetical protein